MRTVLVVGGAGYVGSHTVKRLANGGFPPLVDDVSSGHRSSLRFGEFVLGSNLDKQANGAAFSLRKVNAVIRFAVPTAVGESVAAPLASSHNNVANTVQLHRAMHRNALRFPVFSSPYAVYGPPFEEWLREDRSIGPIPPYAHTKHMVEQILQDRARAWGLRSASMHFFSAAGAGADGDVGKRHEPEARLIPLMLQRVFGMRSNRNNLGDDGFLPHGTCLGDHIHLQAFADAHNLALRHLRGGGGSEVFSLGNGQGDSVREVPDVARAVTDQDIPIRSVSWQGGRFNAACRGYGQGSHRPRRVAVTSGHSGKSGHGRGVAQGRGGGKVRRTVAFATAV